MSATNYLRVGRGTHTKIFFFCDEDFFRSDAYAELEKLNSYWSRGSGRRTACAAFYRRLGSGLLVKLGHHSPSLMLRAEEIGTVLVCAESRGEQHIGTAHCARCGVRP